MSSALRRRVAQTCAVGLCSVTVACAKPSARQPVGAASPSSVASAPGAPAEPSPAPAKSVEINGARRQFVPGIALLAHAPKHLQETLTTALAGALAPHAISNDLPALAPRGDDARGAASSALYEELTQGRVSAVLWGDVASGAAPVWLFATPRDLGEFVPQRGGAGDLVAERALPSRNWTEIEPLVLLLFLSHAYSLGARDIAVDRLEAGIQAASPLLAHSAKWSRLERWALLRNYGYALVLAGQSASRLDWLKAGAQALGEATNLVIKEDLWAETAFDYADALTAIGTRIHSAKLLSSAVTTFPQVVQTLQRLEQPDAAQQARFSFACASVGLARVAKPASGYAPEPEGPVVAGNLTSLFGKRSFLYDAEFTFRDLLEYFTFDRTPLRHIAIQENLSALYLFAAEEVPGTEVLQASIAASKSALGPMASLGTPSRFAEGQRRLAAAYTELAARTASQEGGREAVSALRAALVQVSEQREPVRWAGVQSELGNALSLVAKTETGSGALEEAASAYRAAQSHLEPELHTRLWVRNQSSLGSVLRMLAERTRNLDAAREAVIAHELALSRTPREPTDAWGLAQTELGWSLSRQGELERSLSVLSRASAAFRAALEVRTENGDAAAFAQTSYSLAEVLGHRARLEATPACEALERHVHVHKLAQREGLRILDQTKDGVQRALAQRPVPSPATCPSLSPEVWHHVDQWFASKAKP